MALKSSAAFIAANGFQNSVLTDRALIEALFQSEGVLRAADFAPSPGTGLALKVAGGFAAVEGKSTLDQGFYFVWSDAEEEIAWVAPDTQPRIDTLILRVADAQYGTVAGNQGAYWDIITGVPAASPTARTDSDINTNFAIPGAWMRLCDVRVDPGDTAFVAGDITDVRRISSGITQEGTTAMRDRMDTTKIRPGFTFYNNTASRYEMWNGSTWIYLYNPAEDSGWLALAFASTNWSAAGGYALQYRKIKNSVRIRGMAKWDTGLFTSPIANLPVGYRPAANTWLAAVNGTNGGVVATLNVQGSGDLLIPSTLYYTGSPAAGLLLAIPSTPFLTD